MTKLQSCVICLSLAAAGAAMAQGPPPAPLQQIFLNMGKADEAAVRKEALRQTSALVWPVFRSNPPKVPFLQTFEGRFVPASDATQLAVFSDDGCDVFIEDLGAGKKDSAIKNPVLNLWKKGQHLPALNQSFHVLKLQNDKGGKGKDDKDESIKLEKGRVYEIKVVYSNIIHTDRKDVDGVTLFAYQGGGKLLPPGKKGP